VQRRARCDYRIRHGGDCREQEEPRCGQAIQQHQRHPPDGVLEEHLKPERRFGNDPEQCQDEQPPQVERPEPHAARFQPPQQHREADAEEKGERAPGLALDPDPDDPTDEPLESAGPGVHALVKVHDDHAQECEPAEDVERLDSIAGSGCGGRCEGHGHRAT
jgi:hypothetical protein